MPHFVVGMWADHNNSKIQDDFKNALQSAEQRLADKFKIGSTSTSSSGSSGNDPVPRQLPSNVAAQAGMQFIRMDSDEMPQSTMRLAIVKLRSLSISVEFFPQQKVLLCNHTEESMPIPRHQFLLGYGRGQWKRIEAQEVQMQPPPCVQFGSHDIVCDVTRACHQKG